MPSKLHLQTLRIWRLLPTPMRWTQWKGPMLCWPATQSARRTRQERAVAEEPAVAQGAMGAVLADASLPQQAVVPEDVARVLGAVVMVVAAGVMVVAGAVAMFAVVGKRGVAV